MTEAGPNMKRHAASYRDRGVIEEFVEFLEASEFEIVPVDDRRVFPKKLHVLLDEFFEIDPVALESERREILEQLQT